MRFNRLSPYDSFSAPVPVQKLLTSTIPGSPAVRVIALVQAITINFFTLYLLTFLILNKAIKGDLSCLSLK